MTAGKAGEKESRFVSDHSVRDVNMYGSIGSVLLRFPSADCASLGLTMRAHIGHRGAALTSRAGVACGAHATSAAALARWRAVKPELPSTWRRRCACGGGLAAFNAAHEHARAPAAAGAVTPIRTPTWGTGHEATARADATI